MSGHGWSLEIVRGREVGRVYALGRGETVLGNALNGEPGLDLAPHEGDSPRRMAARQARLDLSAQGLSVHDLDSPEGTFVNRQRLLPGQGRLLQAGDLIQVGGVQLKVVAGAAPAPALRPASPAAKPAATAAKARPATAVARPQQPAPVSPAPAPTPAPAPASSATRAGPLPSAFTLGSGARCRTWDDFLTVSAQRWPSMREELVSGRLASFLVSVGRADVAPSASAPGTPDERLDGWLATLPTTRPSRPELDVHPAAIKLRASPGGGILRSSLQITNTGYRLLRTTVRLEPAGADWVRVPAESARGPIVTVDQTELPIEIHIPETFDIPPIATLVLDSNGGTRRVEVRLERPATAEAVPDAPTASGGPAGLGIRDLVARQPVGLRLVTWSVGALLLRVLVLVAGFVPGGASEGARPTLAGVAIMLAALGCLAAISFALNRGEPRDVPALGFAGGFAGVLAAALLVAACRTIEPTPGPGLAASPIVVCLLWGALGAALAGVSAILAPARSVAEGSS